MVNWNSVISNVGESNLRSFVNGHLSGRGLQDISNVRSVVSTPLRQMGVDRLRNSARLALRRRETL